MLAIALVGVLLFQDPAPTPKPAPQSEQGSKAEKQGSKSDKDVQSSSSSSSKKLETWPDKEARAKVKAFEKAVKPKKVSMPDRKQALDSLVGGISLHLIKPLQQFVEKDSSVVLKKQAVEMLADQPKERAHPAIIKLLKNARITANPQVQASLVTALSKTGYDDDDWKLVEDLIESDYDNERVPVHEALLDLIIEHKEAQAIPMLLRNTDEPSPKDIDGGANPPEAYWKARWHSWAVWRGKVKDALFAITGQRFSTAAEARVWLQKNPLPKKSK